MNIAAVTGSTRGIGKGIAEVLAKNGWRVYTSGTKDISGIPDYIKCDISIPSDRQGFLDAILSKEGRIDLLVNNAGVAPETRLDVLETTRESFERLMRINLEGTFFMCQLFANQMIGQGGGNCRIVNISSISSYASSINRGEYCVSKAGVSMVTQLFAHRLAEYGIGVFEVRPGIILTDMTAAVKDKYERLIEDGLTPIQRFGTPEDVAACVLAIAEGRLDFCTGQALNADGGFHIRRL
ncbi:MAG: 3-ketoacyl-ACP reductase [Defluviitaleaceae bacterium]|nr:3-ketoacyl-ACP reductase [Defluviitaleaceae bacterium]